MMFVFFATHFMTGYTFDSTAGAWPQQVKFTLHGHIFTIGFPECSCCLVWSITFIPGFVMIGDCGIYHYRTNSRRKWPDSKKWQPHSSSTIDFVLSPFKITKIGIYIHCFALLNRMHCMDPHYRISSFRITLNHHQTNGNKCDGVMKK